MKRLILVLIGIAIGAAGAELASRHVAPLHVQMIRGHGLRSIDGVPVWGDDHSRENLGCITRHPDHPRIVVFGDSISYGLNLQADQVWTSILQTRHPEWCVINLSQPAFGYEQLFALARHVLPELHPALVLWESWDTMDRRHYVWADDGSVYDLDVPPDFSAWWFDHSSLYRRWAYIETSDHDYARTTPDYERLTPLVRAAGARLMIFLVPKLRGTFVENNVPDSAVSSAVESDGAVQVIHLAAELAGQDVDALRLDTGGHFNAAGHRQLAPIFERYVRLEL